MRKKSRNATPKRTLQTVKLIPITDPAEIAALERRIREAEKRMAAANSNSRKSGAVHRKENLGTTIE